MNDADSALDFDRINEDAVALARRALSSSELPDPPGRTIFCAISGGHMYGFPSPDSDLDLRGCHVMPLDDRVRLSPPKETFESTDRWFEGVEVDRVSHDLGKYLRILLKNGGYILEQIFSPLVVVSDAAALEELRERSLGAMTRNVVHHYGGFARGLRKDLEGSEEVRAKTVLYLLRVLLGGIHLLETQAVESDVQRLFTWWSHEGCSGSAPLDYLPEVWDHKARDREAATLESSWRARVLGDADALGERMEEAATRSALPEAVPPTARAALDDFLVRHSLAGR